MKLLENWLPPEGAGAPVGCLATTFTFEADFFKDDCLARFLGITGSHKEDSQASAVAALLEEEEKLSEASVVVLADRSYRPQPRNLRWDLLTATVPGALLHAKVAVLTWEHSMRILIGSANLTSAGYRRQIETVVAFDVADTSDIPHEVALGLFDELEDILRIHTAGDPAESGPMERALRLLAEARSRIRQVPAAR